MPYDFNSYLKLPQFELEFELRVKNQGEGVFLLLLTLAPP
jgi:uncharacterized protein YjbK